MDKTYRLGEGLASGPSLHPTESSGSKKIPPEEEEV